MGTAKIFFRKITVRCPLMPWNVYDDLRLRGMTDDEGDLCVDVICDYEHAGEPLCEECCRKIFEMCNAQMDMTGIILPLAPKQE